MADLIPTDTTNVKNEDQPETSNELKDIEKMFKAGENDTPVTAAVTMSLKGTPDAPENITVKSINFPVGAAQGGTRGGKKRRKKRRSTKKKRKQKQKKRAK